MTLVAVDYIAQSTAGDALNGASVTVRDGHTAGAGTVSDIFSDAAGTVLANPFSTTVAGTARFWVQPGKYNITASGAVDSTLLDVPDPAAYATVAAFFADIDAGYTAPNGTVVSAGPVQFQADSSANITGLRAGWVPFGYIMPNHWQDNTTPGTTNMRAALVNALAYSDHVHLLYEHYLISGAEVVISTDKTITGQGWTSGYGAGRQPEGSIIIEDKTTAGNIFKIEGASSAFGDRARTTIKDVGFTSANAKTLTDLSAVSINLFFMENTFLNLFENCLFYRLNVTNVIVGSTAAGTQQNLTTVVGGMCNDIGDARAGFAAVTGGYTYGNGFNFSWIPDSDIINVFIELCGQYGASLGANCRAISVFNDFNWRGYELSGIRAQIIGGGAKWNMENGVYASTGASGWLVDGCNVMLNNRGNNAVATENFGFRLTSGNHNWRISNIYASDATQSNANGKTELQNFIHLGAAGNTGQIDNVSIGDPASSGENFYDPNGNIAAGNVLIDNIRYEGGLDFDGTVNAITGSLKIDTPGSIINFSGHTTATTAMTGGAESVFSGVVQSNNATTLYSATRTSIGPFFAADTIPSVTIVDKTGSANTGAVSVSGFAYRAPFEHTGGGTGETNVVAPLPDKILGHIEVAYGDGSTNSFFLAAQIKLDGGTLTVTDSITTTSNSGAVSLSVSGGNLLISTAFSSAQNGDMVVKFTGTWMEATP